MYFDIWINIVDFFKAKQHKIWHSKFKPQEL